MWLMSALYTLTALDPALQQWQGDDSPGVLGEEEDSLDVLGEEDDSLDVLREGDDSLDMLGKAVGDSGCTAAVD